MTYFLCAPPPRSVWSSQRKMQRASEHDQTAITISESEWAFFKMRNGVSRVWRYLFNLCLLDFFQGDSDLLRLQLGRLLLLNEDTGAQLQELSVTQRQIAFLISSPCLTQVFRHSSSRDKTSSTHTSLNSKQPSKPFTCTSFGPGGAWRLVSFIFLWVAYLPPPTRRHHLHSTGSVCFHKRYVGFQLCVNVRSDTHT